VTAAPHDREDADETPRPPSKSARKRAAHAAQDLGEALVRLREAELEALQLPEALGEAIRAARHITSRAGAARQREQRPDHHSQRPWTSGHELIE